MSCQWLDKVALYADDEMDAASLQAFSAHLPACMECPPVLSGQMELKKAVRMAGTRFTAPPELRAAIYDSIHPRKSVSRWWKWAMAPVCALLLGTIGFLLFPKSQPADPMIGRLVDQHITTLASAHPIDIENSSQHVVKPWFAGKLPFTFNPPELAGSPYTLVGGKLVYAGQNPGAELIYTAGLHKISIFIFQARNANPGSGFDHRLSFNVDRWRQGGLQFYSVTDASKSEAGKLISMFQDANR